MTFLRPLRALVCAAVLLSAGCGGEIPVDVNAGPFTFEIDADRVNLPSSWRMGAMVPSLQCQQPADCPSLGMGAPAVRCAANVCNPDPFTFDLAMPGAVDLNTYSSTISALGSVLDSVTVTAMRFEARSSAVRFAPGPVALYWGPESASAIASDGVRPLGTVPVLRFAAGTTQTGDVAIDPAGSAALGQHILRTSRRFRVFARASVDVEPGAAIPMGQAAVSVTLSLRVIGDFVR